MVVGEVIQHQNKRKGFAKQSLSFYFDALGYSEKQRDFDS